MGMKNMAACNICFEKKNYTKGTISYTGGSTSGLLRHLWSHHLAVFEAGEKVSTSTNNMKGHFKTKAKEPWFGMQDKKEQFKVAATFWAIEEAVPFHMFSRPTFRNLFKSLNKRSGEIVNIDDRGIREMAMKMGKYAEEATLEEIKNREVSWTTDHWTGPNDESYSTVTAHYINKNWVLQSAILDFKVFSGSTTGENIYHDIESVLANFQGESTIALDTIGITDTTGNMGKLGAY